MYYHVHDRINVWSKAEIHQLQVQSKGYRDGIKRKETR